MAGCDGERAVGNPENALIDFYLEVDGVGAIGIISQYNVNRIRAKPKEPSQRRICPKN
jgi:hypothetical protein